MPSPANRGQIRDLVHGLDKKNSKTAGVFFCISIALATTPWGMQVLKIVLPHWVGFVILGISAVSMLTAILILLTASRTAAGILSVIAACGGWWVWKLYEASLNDPRVSLQLAGPVLLIESLGAPDKDLYIRIASTDPILQAIADDPTRVTIFTRPPPRISAPFAPSIEIHMQALSPHETRRINLLFGKNSGSIGTIAIDASSERCGAHCKDVFILAPPKIGPEQ